MITARSHRASLNQSCAAKADAILVFTIFITKP